MYVKLCQEKSKVGVMLEIKLMDDQDQSQMDELI